MSYKYSILASSALVSLGIIYCRPSMNVQGRLKYTSGGNEADHKIEKLSDIPKILEEMEKERQQRCSGTCKFSAFLSVYRKQSSFLGLPDKEKNYQKEMIVESPKGNISTCVAYEEGINKIRDFVSCMENFPLQAEFEKCLAAKK